MKPSLESTSKAGQSTPSHSTEGKPSPSDDGCRWSAGERGAQTTIDELLKIDGVVPAGEFKLSKMNWVPQQGWAYSGGEWTVAIGGNRGVFVETAKADFNRLFQALVGR
jgi:hypothetical protein